MDGATDLEDGTDIDDEIGNDVGAPLDDIGGDTDADTRQATLTFELNNDLDLGESTIPSIAPGNAPVWTAFNGDPPNLYYRNRARRLTNDRRILYKDDPNYVEYHALAYLVDEENEELVRVDVVFLNYDDREDNNAGRSTDVNWNALEGENIALGLEFAGLTVTNSDGDSPVTGSVSYRGRYLGRNRLTFTGDEAYDVDGSEGDIDEIAGGTPIVVRESNIPVMTMNVNFGADDNQVSFTIRDARLSIDQGVGGVSNVEGSMNLNIEGEAALTLPATGGAISLSSAAITGLEAENLRLTFTEGFGTTAVTDTDTIRLGTLDVGDAAADDLDPTAGSSITGYFFNRGRGAVGAVLQARAVAGNIYWDASGTHEHTPPGATDPVVFDVDHEMTGVFLLER